MYLLSHLISLGVGFVLGIIATSFYVSREMTKAQRRLEKHFGDGEEWKEGKDISDKDENWLRRRLDGNKDKETE